VFYRHATTVNNSPTPNGVFGRLMDIIRLHIDTVRLGKGGNKQVKNKLRTTPTGQAYDVFRLALSISLESSFIFLIFFIHLSIDTGSWSFSLAPTTHEQTDINLV
jgi:hypothetical protein